MDHLSLMSFQPGADYGPVFGDFVNTGLHSSTWKITTYAMIVFKQSAKFINRNRKLNGIKYYAEQLAMVEATNIMNSAEFPPMVVRMYTNYAPSSNMEQFETFLETSKQKFGPHTTMEIVFSAFRNIRRPSCSDRDCGTASHFEKDPNERKYQNHSRSPERWNKITSDE
jgi:hypothetical protein